MDNRIQVIVDNFYGGQMVAEMTFEQLYHFRKEFLVNYEFTEYCNDSIYHFVIGSSRIRDTEDVFMHLKHDDAIYLIDKLQEIEGQDIPSYDPLSDDLDYDLDDDGDLDDDFLFGKIWSIKMKLEMQLIQSLPFYLKLSFYEKRLLSKALGFEKIKSNMVKKQLFLKWRIDHDYLEADDDDFMIIIDSLRYYLYNCDKLSDYEFEAIEELIGKIYKQLG